MRQSDPKLQDSQKPEIKRYPRIVRGKQVVGLAILAWEGRKVHIRPGKKQGTELVIRIPVPSEFKKREPVYRVLFLPKGTSWTKVFEEKYRDTLYGDKPVARQVENALRAAYFEAVKELISRAPVPLKGDFALAQIDLARRMYEAEQPTSGPQRSLKTALRLTREYDQIMQAIKTVRSQRREQLSARGLRAKADQLVSRLIVKQVLSALGRDPDKGSITNILTGELSAREIALTVVRCKEETRNRWVSQTTIEEDISWARSFLKEWDLLPE
jgi:hypothetical protein